MVVAFPAVATRQLPVFGFPSRKSIPFFFTSRLYLILTSCETDFTSVNLASFGSPPFLTQMGGSATSVQDLTFLRYINNLLTNQTFLAYKFSRVCLQGVYLMWLTPFFRKVLFPQKGNHLLIPPGGRLQLYSASSLT